MSNSEAPPRTTVGVKEVVCTGCKTAFPSKNALFRHLRSASGSCLSEEDYKDFLKYVVNREENMEKIAVLYGYVPSDYQLHRGLLPELFTSSPPNDDDGDNEVSSMNAKKVGDLVKSSKGRRTDGVRGGNHAAQLLVEAIEYVSLGGQRDEGEDNVPKKILRSYGHVCRGIPIVSQEEEGTGAISEILCTRAPPLLVESSSDQSQEDVAANQDTALKVWLDQVNMELKRRISNLCDDSSKEEGTYCPGKIQVFGRHAVKKKFNPELDVTNKRMDYLIPAEFLAGTEETLKLIDSLGSFGPTITVKKENHDLSSNESKTSTAIEKHPHNIKSVHDLSTQTMMFKFKKLMQRFTTQIMEVDPHDRDAILQRTMNQKKRKRLRRGLNQQQKTLDRRSKQNEGKSEATAMILEDSEDMTPDVDAAKESSKETKRNKQARVLKRKRFHNFTPSMMAHEYLANRRLDRFFHRATVRWTDISQAFGSQNDVHLKMIGNRPFVVLSMTGDLFLFGQARALVGLFIAIAKGLISEDFIDCIFDEDYPSLVPAPFAPLTGSYLGESMYMTWEGKMKFILTPRPTSRYTDGWNTEDILNQIDSFQKIIQGKIMTAWCSAGPEEDLATTTDSNDRIMHAKSVWISNYLVPWSKRANKQLEEYKAWKRAQETATSSEKGMTIAEALLPELDSIDSAVPSLYEKVLFYLREANSGGKWPSTTPKRQLVMVSSTNDGNNKYETPTLAEAHIRAQSNNEERASPYEYREGEGGASGSFSVGAMPGQCDQPKGNILFPELMKAAFELEIALCPDREPSSTIAINRNAQFRPHVDSGAGAGQSTSLIVGLGTYIGGELLVEGEKNDIRYNPVEFNGWKQRHWTLPFKGERFSLVWFTPKGCEGVRGIDLCHA